MQINSISRAMAALATVAALAYSSTAAAGGLVYSIKPLPVSAEITPVSAHSINKKGDVVGEGALKSGGYGCYRFSGDVTTALPGSAKHRCADLNDSGDVVGHHEAGLTTAYVWKRNGSQVLLDGMTRATGINADGDVVGEMRVNNVAHAALYKNKKAKDLGTLDGGAGTSSASRINDLGEITGTASSPNGQRAFRLKDGVMTDVGVLVAGDVSSAGYDINVLGQIVGSSVPANGVAQGFVTSSSGLLKVANDDDTKNFPSGINQMGEMVGTLVPIAGGKSIAYLSRKGKVYHLIDLLDATGADWSELSYAHDINDSRRIVGQGIYKGRKRAFIAERVH